MFETLKRVFVGRPLATSEQEHQRIPKTIALAVFSSDAISSTAYATEEILFVTVIGTSSLALGLNALIPISIAVALLLAIVTTSYRQTIFAYPSGGGSYVVSRENLGENPSLVAGASLLVDYILTVAVSISAGVAAIISIPQFDGLAKHRVELGLVLILLITLANLRGIKESGRIFAFPTYLYIVVLTALVFFGLTKSFFGWFGGISTIPYDHEASEAARQAGGTLSLFLILKGFSSGAVALTGVEAISNGVPAFRRPSRRTQPGRSPPWRSSSARCSSASPCSRTACIRTRATTSPCSRRWARRCSATTCVLDPPAGNGRHPHAGGEHCVCGLPAPVVDHRERRLPPATARQPG